jgi:hypothetical protein
MVNQARTCDMLWLSSGLRRIVAHRIARAGWIR